MKDTQGKDINIGDSVWFIPKPTHREDILLKGVVTKITAKTITVEAEWWWSKSSNSKSVMEFRRNPSNVVLVDKGNTSCLKCKTIKE